MEEVHSFCRICSAHCGVVVSVDGERVHRVAGDRQHPMSGGYTCSKGRQLGLIHHHERRLDYPLVRRGSDLIRVGWDESLDDVEARLRSILQESGPGAIGRFAATPFAYDAWVRVRSHHGALEALVRWQDEIPPGAVSIAHGFGSPNVNRLTSAREDLDPHTGMPRLTGIEVSVERIEGAGEGARV